MPASTLSELQQWLMSQLLHPQATESVIQQHLKTNAKLSATARLQIYQTGYKLRLLECMKAEFAALHTFLGDDLFQLFALGYIQQRPSQSYTLFDLGAGFAEFLAATKPPPHQLPPEQHAALLIPEQLAHLERYRALSMRAVGCEQAPPVAAGFDLLEVGALLPSLSLPDTTFLMQCDFDLLNYLKVADRGETPSFPVEKPQSLLIYRHRYRVGLVALEPWQANFIHAIQQPRGGQPLFSDIAQHTGFSEGQLLAKLSLWLPLALEMNYLATQHQ